MFNVLYFGSHPELNNDDCHTGTEHETIEEARKAFSEDPPAFCFACTEYIMLDGPDVNEVRRNPHFRPSRKDDSWQREFAMQAGMMVGVEAYNDAMGY